MLTARSGWCGLFACMVLLAIAAGIAAPRQALASTADLHPNTWLKHADTSWYNGEASGDYEISTAEQLAGLSLLIADRSGVQFSNSTFTLTRDIDLSKHTWYPIGSSRDASHPAFGGIFDGAGHTISGLKMTDNSICMGLFGQTEGGLIENLTVEGDIIAEYDAAGVVVTADGTQFDKVVNKVNVTNTSDTYANAGGIVASFSSIDHENSSSEAREVAMRECVNYGSITTKSAAGSAGGLVGSVMQDNGIYHFIRCNNYGEVHMGASKNDYSIHASSASAGGLVGWTVFNGSYRFQECVNEGDVSCDGPETAAGGLVGFLSGNDVGSYVMYSYNIGNVSGEGAAAGGVVGQVSDGNAAVAFTYNAGKVTGNNPAAIAALTGEDTMLSSNVFLKGTAPGAFSGGEDIEGAGEMRTLDGMKTQATLDLLNNGATRDYFSIEEGKNNGLPILGGTKHPGKGGTTDEGEGDLSSKIPLEKEQEKESGSGDGSGSAGSTENGNEASGDGSNGDGRDDGGGDAGDSSDGSEDGQEDGSGSQGGEGDSGDSSNDGSSGDNPTPVTVGSSDDTAGGPSSGVGSSADANAAASASPQSVSGSPNQEEVENEPLDEPQEPTEAVNPEAQEPTQTAQRFKELKLAEVETPRDTVVPPDISNAAALFIGFMFLAIAIWGFVWRYFDYYTQRGRRNMRTWHAVG